MSAPVTFSVIVVCKDAGEKLLSTVKSALEQTYPHFEILVKDGMSAEDPHVTLAELGRDSEALRRSTTPQPAEAQTADSAVPQELFDDSAASAPGAVLSEAACPASRPSLRILVSPDAGIYDAMNQAVSAASGDYFLFLNCGDSFASPDVLAKTAAYLGEHPEVLLPYGHRINGMTGVLEYAPKEITPFILFRGLPCHQACFYHRSLFAARGYDTRYRVRADYEHFFYCYYSGAARIRLMDFPVCVYEGGGFSETPANLKVSAKEHREICSRYFTPLQHFKYRLWPVVTLQPLRKKLADSRFFGTLYQKLKRAAE